MKKRNVNSIKKRRSKQRQPSMMMKRETKQMFCTVIVLMATTTTGRTRIPEDQHGFDDYIHGAKEYLNAIRGSDPQVRGLMLGLTAQNLTDLVNDWFNVWWTGNAAAPGLWEKHTNVYGNTNTSTTNQDVVDFMEAFGDFFRPLLNTMAASSALDNEDRHILRIAHADGSHGDRPAITRVLIVNLTSLPGGHVKVTTRWVNDSSRPSRDPLADGIEFKYIIVPPGGQAPNSVNDCTLYKYSKTAIFHLDHVPQLAGYRLYGYARSVNLSEPAKSGDWNTIQSVIIQG